MEFLLLRMDLKAVNEMLREFPLKGDYKAANCTKQPVIATKASQLDQRFRFL